MHEPTRPTPEILDAYYELWLSGSDASTIVERLNDAFPTHHITPKYITRHLPALHAYCRQRMVRDTRTALTNDQLPPNVVLTPERRSKLLELVGCGATLQRAADMLNVPLVTITDRWYLDDPDLRTEVAVVRDTYDYRVVAAAHRRAIGYDVPVTETHEINEETERGYRRGTTVVTKTTHVPGSTTAQTLWLKARLGWSDAPHDANDDVAVEYDVRSRLYDSGDRDNG
jgi:hypothetical protein